MKKKSVRSLQVGDSVEVKLSRCVATHWPEDHEEWYQAKVTPKLDSDGTETGLIHVTLPNGRSFSLPGSKVRTAHE